ncbi:MAG: methyltransferase domain-containing protein [Acidimicrobiia bacterium]|nr:methyltransferase domain-containing protein [Acidimicrobiia bacterium]
MDFDKAQLIASANAPSPYYDAEYRAMERMYLPALFNTIGDLTPRRVLEIGPGWGTTAVWLRSRGHDVTVMDLMPIGTFMTESMCDEFGIRFVHNDIEDRPVPDGTDMGTFDLVIMTQVIPHLAWRPDRTLGHIVTLMAPEAEFVTSVLDLKDYRDLDTAFGTDWTQVPEWGSGDRNEEVVKCMYSKSDFRRLLRTTFSKVKIWKPFRSTVLFARAKV